MSKLPSMPLYPADFFADTAHLSGEAAGIYLILLAHAWLRGGSLPNDPRALARLARVSWQRWAVIKGEILPFWKLGPDGLLRQSRLSEDYKNVLSKTEMASQNSMKRWAKKPNHFNGSGNANAYTDRPISNANQNQIYKDSLNGEIRQESGNRVFVKEGTPQWNAWEPVYRKEHGVGPPTGHPDEDRTAVGWWFPSEWPPKMSSPLRSV